MQLHVEGISPFGVPMEIGAEGKPSMFAWRVAFFDKDPQTGTARSLTWLINAELDEAATWEQLIECEQGSLRAFMKTALD